MLALLIKIILYSWLLLGVIGPVSAGFPQVTIEGRWYPGSLLRGKAPPNSDIEVLGHKLTLTENGEFVFGLGRDEKGPVEVTLALPGGKKLSFDYVVQKRSYNIQKIEGVESKYVSPPQAVLDRIRKEANLVRAARATNEPSLDYRESFQWPVKGRITGVYGSQRYYNGVAKRPHYGIDIAAKHGTKVVAPASGKVSLAHGDMYYSGGTLIIDHGYGVSSTFIHLSKILVEVGKEISQGEVIAEVGSTGRSTGPHLDWRLNWFDQRLDPQLLVRGLPIE